MAIEKKLEEMTLKIEASEKRVFSGLTSIKGSNPSAVIREMIRTYIRENKSEFEAMKSIFDEADPYDQV